MDGAAAARLRTATMFAAAVGLLGCGEAREQTMSDWDWGEKTVDLAVAAATPKPSVRAGEPVVLHTALKNFGFTPVRLVAQSPWVDYEVEVRDSAGRLLPLTKLARERMDMAEEGSRAVSELGRGALLTGTYPLSEAFVLSAKGRYTVVAKRTTFGRGDSPGFVSLTSKPLVLEVVD